MNTPDNEHRPIGTAHPSRSATERLQGPVDWDWLGRHDQKLKDVQHLLTLCLELLHIPDGTRPQIVRGRGQQALDRLREAKAILDIAMVPFDEPFTLKQPRE